MTKYKKTAFVIGASGEIGEEVVRALSKQNFQLILHYNENENVIKRLMNELKEEQLLAVIQADLTKEREIKKIENASRFNVDTIIFCQGLAHYQLLTDISEDTIDALYNVHVKSTMLISKVFLKDMIRNQHGNIIVVSSIWGEIGASNEVAYSTMKGAQIAFVKSLAKEVGSSNIRVNAVSPGLVKTKMNRHLNEQEIQEWVDQVPLQKVGTVQDVANTISFLTSEYSNYIHGQVIRLNGGML